ncbi:MAG: ATP-binding cassette domain-containing protein [Bacteroidetes bacterium]|nr:ATP-binding cassette domain-containing protein [Bacteroidota bacterium]
MNYSLHNTVLFVENLSVAYDDRVVIKNINFEEKNVVIDGRTTGQTIAIVGRSGRGKSTLFKALTGLVQPTAGSVLIADTTRSDINAAKAVKEGDVGFVDQKYTLFRNKTISQTFEFALRHKNMSKAEKNDLIKTYLDSWGLEKFKDQYPCELSGGQRQRTAIIEQILSSGHYMVLDEPFSGLDVGNIESVKKSFRLITTQHDLNTVIFSTHDIELAVELADSIYVIGYPTLNGNIADYGTIVKHIDLKKMGLAWSEFDSQHLQLVKEIKEAMLQS